MEKIEIPSAKLVPEIQKAINEGYTWDFLFEDGFVFWDQRPEVKYWIANLKNERRVCLITETIVFRIEFPCGLKGCAVYDYKTLNDE
ncbi:MAG: hypothetical protein JWO92_11 [Chitinophagaceae bacterium]|nr:hypothetical protein [Chitinophagaceae bacterium]